MLLNERRRPWSSSAIALIALCLFVSVWHLGTFPGEQLETPVRPALPVYEIIKAPTTDVSFDIQQLPMWDYTTLIDLEEFMFDVLNCPCNDSSKPPMLLVLVHSAPRNFAKRKTIRSTWGHTQKSVHLLFVLGRVSDAKYQTEIDEENRKYNDILQGSFIDSYRNMTYKHVMALKYSVYHCPEARYILKTDDDIFVNMPMLLNFLRLEISPYGARKLIFCTPIVNANVKRSYRSKWRVSPREYPDRTYPTYCLGWAVIYSPDVAFTLYDKAQQAEYFWIDDVHITGTLVKRANYTHTSFKALTLDEAQTKSLIEPNSNDSINFLYGSPDLPQNTIVQLWKVVQRHLRQNGTVT